MLPFTFEEAPPYDEEVYPEAEDNDDKEGRRCMTDSIWLGVADKFLKSIFDTLSLKWGVCGSVGSSEAMFLDTV